MTLVRRDVQLVASRERAWAALTDFERMPEWFFGVARMEIFGTPVGVDTERRLTLVHRQSHRERIASWEPGKLFTVVVLDPPAFTTDWTGRIRLEEIGGALWLRWEMEWTPRFGALGVLLNEALVKPVVGTALRLSLRRFKRRVEAER